MTKNLYSEALNPARAPQSEAIPGREAEMKPNRAGGYTFALDPWKQLERFLILGAEGPTYYATGREMILDNARALQYCLAEDGPRVVALAASIDSANRAPKRGPLLFALGVALARGDDATKGAVVDAIPAIVRTASDLFQLLSVLSDVKGRPAAGRSTRRVIAAWYNGKDPQALAYQMAKYRARAGFTHQDALRLGHVRPATEEHGRLFRWAAREGAKPAIDLEGDFARILRGFGNAQLADTPKLAAQAVEEYGLTWEMVPSEHLGAPEVWEALLPNLPYRALIRNLGRMSAIGLVKPLSAAAQQVAERINDREALRRARVHPIAVLSALMTYRQGHGERGSLTWQPAREVSRALEYAFESAFNAVEPTGKRFYLGVDVSGSMGFGQIAGVPGLSPALGAAVLALATARQEPRHALRAFSAGAFNAQSIWTAGRRPAVSELPISAESSFYDACQAMSGWAHGPTDCALPMLDALESALEVDVFVVLTDNQTWYGDVHPAEALRRYRREAGIDARLAVIAMTANGDSIADPKDPGMLDVAGFDAAGHEILRGFALGEL